MLYCGDCTWCHDDGKCWWGERNPTSCEKRMSQKEWNKRMENFEPLGRIAAGNPAKDAEWEREHPGGPGDAYGPYHRTRLAMGTVIVPNDIMATGLSLWERFKGWARRLF